MKLLKLVGTVSFKLSALYLGLFLISFLAIGASVYLLTCHTLEQQLKANIETEANRLKAEYDAGGIAELKDEIAEIIGSQAQTQLVYGVIGQNGGLMAGNFHHFQAYAGWQIATLPFPETPLLPAGKRLLYIKVIALPNQQWLGVGQHADSVQNAGDAVIQAFTVGLGLVILLGAIGGFYISRAFLDKIRRITLATQTIIAGDLTHRLPVSKNRDELDQLAAVLNRMLDKIGALIENVQQVSNDIAHDLRTPISHLKYRLEEALNGKRRANQYQEHIASAIEETDTILATFSAMLRISQIESGSRRSAFKKLNFSQVVVSVADALSPVAEEQGKTIGTDINPETMLVGDKELLTQLVFNLLENAITHTPRSTRISIGLHTSGTHTELVVADTGPGIAEAEREKAFRRFYRLEQSRTTPGNGLGLSIVAAIVELHDGTVVLADNHPGLKVAITFAANRTSSHET